MFWPGSFLLGTPPQAHTKDSYYLYSSTYALLLSQELRSQVKTPRTVLSSPSVFFLVPVLIDSHSKIFPLLFYGKFLPE